MQAVTDGQWIVEMYETGRAASAEVKGLPQEGHPRGIAEDGFAGKR